MEPLVSIIVPVYNVKKYLDRCMYSLLHQTYTNLEIILVDDGSTDGSSEVCDMYAQEDRRIVVHHQSNAGVSAARNWALDNMNGEYLLFVDADDFIDLQLVAYCIQTAISNGAEIIVFTYTEWNEIRFSTPYYKESPSIDATQSTASIFKKILLDQIPNMVWTSFYKCNLWRKIRFSSVMAYEDLMICPAVFVQSKKSIQLKNILYYYYKENVNSLTYGMHTYNSVHRYCKYLAYKEHLRWAEKLDDSEVRLWALYHMTYDAIKILYVDFYSPQKLSKTEKKELRSFLKDVWTPDIKCKMKLKQRFLRWAALQCPVICKVYSFIRYKQEKTKNSVIR